MKECNTHGVAPSDDRRPTRPTPEREWVRRRVRASGGASGVDLTNLHVEGARAVPEDGAAAPEDGGERTGVHMERESLRDDTL